MQIDENRLFTLEETAQLLSVSRSTLRSWDRSKFFIAGRTKGDHRRYTGKQIKEMQEQMFNKEDS